MDALLSDQDDFRIWCWDNASDDATRDLLTELGDERIVKRHFHEKNVNQTEPMHWFLDQAPQGLVGKIDDDILLPHGWVKRISGVLSSSERFGMLGCWIYMPSDYQNDTARHNIVNEGGHSILAATTLAGHSFLARRDVLRKFLHPRQKRVYGIPVHRGKMTISGFLSGYPMPLLFAHNMDDPRSEYCIMNGNSEMTEMSALTARKLRFKSPEEYARWIKADALRRQVIPYKVQVEQLRQTIFRQTFVGKIFERSEAFAMRCLNRG